MFYSLGKSACDSFIKIFTLETKQSLKDRRLCVESRDLPVLPSLTSFWHGWLSEESGEHRLMFSVPCFLQQPLLHWSPSKQISSVS